MQVQQYAYLYTSKVSNLGLVSPEMNFRTQVSIRQHTSAYVSIRQHTLAYVSIRMNLGLVLPEMNFRTQVVSPTVYP